MSIYKIACSLFLVLIVFHGYSQGEDSLIIVDEIICTAPIGEQPELNMDAVYNRPFVTKESSPLAVGGYLEANSLYSNQDGISEGLSFQARRLTMFMSASIANNIKFLSELEFEDGTKEIVIEFAAIDVNLHPSLNLRGGVVMSPIGAFNQNHDGPNWEFVERPDVSVNMLPATWSNAGFGVYGKTYFGNWTLGYEAYLTNGFDNSIVDNEENKTFLPSAKANPFRFEESSNGAPLTSAKLALRNASLGEIGFSYMGQTYNQFEADGVVLDDKRRLDVFAVDVNTTIKPTRTKIIGELVFINIDVADTYSQQFGRKQQGYFVDVVQPILKKDVFNWKNAVLNFATRFDYVDWNVGQFNEDGNEIGDHLSAITPALSFRPVPQTVFRLNYRYQWQTDIINSPASLKASWLFGFSTYF